MRSRGKLVVISASSGTGKTTVCHRLMERDNSLKFSISCTSRARREGERDGVDYYFIPATQFEEWIREGRFAEWEKIYGDYYGTLNSVLSSALEKGEVLLLDIDVKGALSIKKLYPEDTIAIFLKAPSREEVERRLKNRKTEDEKSVKLRMERYDEEQKLAKGFDYIVVNDDLEKTINKIYEIIKGVKDGC